MHGIVPVLGSNQFGFKGKIDCYSALKSLADFLIAFALPTNLFFSLKLVRTSERINR